MDRPHAQRTLVLVAVLGAAALTRAIPVTGTMRTAPESIVDGRTYGMPAAEVFRDHEFADAQKGAVGRIRAGPVTETAHRAPMEH